MIYMNLLKTAILVIGLLSAFNINASLELTPSNFQQYNRALQKEHATITFENFEMCQVEDILFSLKGYSAYSKFKNNLEEWVEVRKSEQDLIIRMILLIKQALNEPFGPDDIPQLSIIPPVGSGYDVPVSPHLIKDKKLRTLYEKAINDNRAKGKKSAKHNSVQQGSDLFFEWSQNYLVKTLSLPPYQKDLKSILQRSKLDDEMISRIVESVKINNSKKLGKKVI